MTVVDLFSGCGGFSLGAHAAGLEVKAAFDIDPILTSTFPSNFPRTELILQDIASLNGRAVKAATKGRVDGLIGGPPCQGFSAIGRRDAADPRRRLVMDFFRLVAELRPAFFVMENVRGLFFEASRVILDDAISGVCNRYRILGPLMLDAARFGAATSRCRLFVIGLDASRCDPLSIEDMQSLECEPATVREAIADLSDALQIGADSGFDVWKLSRRLRPSAYAAGLRAPDGKFTGHRRTEHTAEVVRRFKRVKPGQVDKIGRHPRLSWDGQCPALRAGTGADRGSYQSVRPIHPAEPRVITVREAARLQGFPDFFRFHPTVWHSFRMIGNSVSPIVARAILTAIASRTDVPRRTMVAAE